MDQWTMRQSSLELQLMIKQSTNNVSLCFSVHQNHYVFKEPSMNVQSGADV